MRIRLKRIGVLGVVVGLALLAGCSSYPTADRTVSEIMTARERLLSLHAFKLRGRMAFRQDDVNYPGRFVWDYRDRIHSLELVAPLGQGWLTLNSTPILATLETSTGLQVSDSSMDQLLQRVVGFDVPATLLRYWILGLPAPGYDYEVTEGEGGVYSEIVQQGWKINCRNFEVNDGVWVPKRITAVQDNLEMRVVVHERILMF